MVTAKIKLAKHTIGHTALVAEIVPQRTFGKLGQRVVEVVGKIPVKGIVAPQGTYYGGLVVETGGHFGVFPHPAGLIETDQCEEHYYLTGKCHFYEGKPGTATEATLQNWSRVFKQNP